jgi:hypothetical protein
MRPRHLITTVSLAALALAALTGLRARAQQPAAPAAALRPLERLDGTVSVRGKNGELRRLALSLRNWIIDSHRRIERFPETGLLVIQVRAGYAYVTVAGQRRLRGTDQFFTVPAGATMSIETDDDAAILQVVSLREPAAPAP